MLESVQTSSPGVLRPETKVKGHSHFFHQNAPKAEQVKQQGLAHHPLLLVEMPQEVQSASFS